MNALLDGIFFEAAEKDTILQQFAKFNITTAQQVEHALLNLQLDEHLPIGLLLALRQHFTPNTVYLSLDKQCLFCPKLKAQHESITVCAFTNAEIGAGIATVFDAIIPQLGNLPCVAKRINALDETNSDEVGRITTFWEKYYSNTKSTVYPKHFVRIYGIVKHTGLHWIVMEKMDGDLSKLLYSNSGAHANARGKLTIEDRLYIMQQCTECLNFLHSQGLAHRDIKSRNFLYSTTSTNKLIIKLCDFGSLRVTNNATMLGVNGGSITHVAPERLFGNSLAPTIDEMQQSDMYSIGIVLAELFWNIPPFIKYCASSDWKGLEDARRNPKTQKMYPYSQMPKSTMYDLVFVLQNCMSFTLGKRPNIMQLLEAVQNARLAINTTEEIRQRLEPNCESASQITSVEDARWFLEWKPYEYCNLNKGIQQSPELIAKYRTF